MKQNKKLNGTSLCMAAGVLIGVIVSLFVMLLGSGLFAWLISAEKMDESVMAYGTILILLLSTSVGCWIASKKIGRLRIQVCLLTGGSYYLVLLSITMLFFGGQYQGIGIATILVILASGMTALLGLRMKKTRKSKFKKRGYC